MAQERSWVQLLTTQEALQVRSDTWWIRVHLFAIVFVLSIAILVGLAGVRLNDRLIIFYIGLLLIGLQVLRRTNLAYRSAVLPEQPTGNGSGIERTVFRPRLNFWSWTGMYFLGGTIIFDSVKRYNGFKSLIYGAAHPFKELSTFASVILIPIFVYELLYAVRVMTSRYVMQGTCLTQKTWFKQLTLDVRQLDYQIQYKSLWEQRIGPMTTATIYVGGQKITYMPSTYPELHRAVLETACLKRKMG